MLFKHEDDKTLTYVQQYTLDKFNEIPKKQYKFQTFTTGEKKQEIKFNRSLAIGIIILIISIGFIKIINKTSTANNPILGKWRTNTIMGTMDIEFNRNSMSGLGMKGNVRYEIKDNKVLVIDEGLNIGTTYTIHDKNTMYTDTFGVRSIYKRIQ